MKEKNKKQIKIAKSTFYQMISVALAIALIVSVGLSFSKTGTGCFIAGNPETVGKNTVDYINTNLLSPEMSAKLISATTENNMYVLNLDIMGQPQPVYVSGDGKILLISAIDMSESVPEYQQDQGQENYQMNTAAVEEMIMGINDDPEKVMVYFFYGEGCPYCAQQETFFETIVDKYPEMEIRMFEIYYNTDNQLLYMWMADEFGEQAGGVPATFIGDKSWIGFNAAMGSEMESYISGCIESACASPILRLK